MTTHTESNSEAPNHLKLWICCRCGTPRLYGSSIECKTCGSQLHDTGEYSRASAHVVVDHEALVDQVLQVLNNPGITEATYAKLKAVLTAASTVAPVEQSEDAHPGYDCGGTCVIHCGRFTAADPSAAAQDEAAELLKLRQAIGWICDAADAAYIEDDANKRIHEIFNIAAQAAGFTRRLPDEHGRFDESSVG